MVKLPPKLPTEQMTKNPLELPSPPAAGTLPKTDDNKVTKKFFRDDHDPATGNWYYGVAKYIKHAAKPLYTRSSTQMATRKQWRWEKQAGTS
jgi:hypothetical protein